MGTQPRWVQTPAVVSYFLVYRFCVDSRTQHDQPLGLLDTVAVGLGITQRLPLGVLGLLDLALGAVTDEDGLAAPLDNDLCCLSCRPIQPQCLGGRTFLPSGMAARSISTLAWAKTSAEADMLTRKSVAQCVSW